MQDSKKRLPTEIEVEYFLKNQKKMETFLKMNILMKFKMINFQLLVIFGYGQVVIICHTKIIFL